MAPGGTAGAGGPGRNEARALLTAVASWPESLVRAPGGDKPGGPWSASCSPERGDSTDTRTEVAHGAGLGRRRCRRTVGAQRR